MVLFNVIIFIRVIVVLIRRARDNASRQNKAISHKTILRLLVSIGGVMFLFGLTWLFAIFTFSEPVLREIFEVLFVVFNSLQGLFIFLFVCVLNKEVLESWREVISCGRYQSKLLHPSPVKITAARNYNQANTGSSGFSSSTGAKYISHVSTAKDSYVSTALNVPKLAQSPEQEISTQDAPVFMENRVISDHEEMISMVKEERIKPKQQELKVTVEIEEEDKETWTTNVSISKRRAVNVTLKLEEECASEQYDNNSV